MSISKLPVSASQSDALIKQLETPTFVSSYTDKYLGKGTSWIKKIWASLWLGGLGRNGWKAGAGVRGVGSLNEERACVANYKLKLANLVTHLAKTPLKDKTHAKIMNQSTENGTSPNDTENERSETFDQLEGKIQAFYKALKERVEQLTGTDNLDADSITKQAALYQAGLKEVADKIREHNQVRKETYFDSFKKPYIKKEWSMVVDFEIAKIFRTTLADQITIENVSDKGLKTLADKVDVYVKTFESNKTIKKLELMEDKKSIVASVHREIVETRGDEFQAEKELYESGECAIPELTPRITDLMRQRKNIKEALDNYNNQIKKIEIDIYSDIEERKDSNIETVNDKIADLISDKEVDSFLRSAVTDWDMVKDYDEQISNDKAIISALERADQDELSPDIWTKIQSLKKLYKKALELETTDPSNQNILLTEKIENENRLIQGIEPLAKKCNLELQQIDLQLIHLNKQAEREQMRKAENLNHFAKQNLDELDEEAFFNVVYADPFDSLEQPLSDELNLASFEQPKPAELNLASFEQPKSVELNLASLEQPKPVELNLDSLNLSSKDEEDIDPATEEELDLMQEIQRTGTGPAYDSLFPAS